jgi:hypothetical protein
MGSQDASTILFIRIMAKARMSEKHRANLKSSFAIKVKV